MGTYPLSDELAQEAATLFQAFGSKVEAAKHATNPAGGQGINEASFRNRLTLAAQRGFMGTDVVLPGFTLKRSSVQRGPDGEVERTWAEQAPEHGEEFAMPEGHVIKGVSALVDPDNRVIAQWIKTREGAAEHVTNALKAAFDAYNGFAVLPPAPAHTDANLATVYNIADHHLGLYAWARESGEDYDLTIGEQILKRSMANLVAGAPASQQAVILNLGDFYHSDSNDNETARSHNKLDVDTRYAKVLQVGVELMINCVQLALQKHASVVVRCLPGNHDPHTALCLSIALNAFFSNEPRVTVDCDPSKFFWWRFGDVFVAATHGDMVKPEEMPGVMASRKSKDWGETSYRYAYFGHVHHKAKGGGEKHGVIWETFQSLAAKSAWESASGYTSGRSMTAIHLHREMGEVSRNTVSIK